MRYLRPQGAQQLRRPSPISRNNTRDTPKSNPSARPKASGPQKTQRFPAKKMSTTTHLNGSAVDSPGPFTLKRATRALKKPKARGGLISKLDWYRGKRLCWTMAGALRKNECRSWKSLTILTRHGRRDNSFQVRIRPRRTSWKNRCKKSHNKNCRIKSQGDWVWQGLLHLIHRI